MTQQADEGIFRASDDLHTEGFDVVGDIHGQVDALERMLTALGYEHRNGVYTHPTRRLVFVGDLIDRGPGQVQVLRIARAMVDAGSALMVLGNHEFNAAAWATRNTAGEWARPHDAKNRHQHEAFLTAVVEGSSDHREWIEWFMTQPMWVDLDGLRVVHACWDPVSMDVLGDGTVTGDMVRAPKGTPEYEAIEVVLKGPEIDLAGHSYEDKGGVMRKRARMRWWEPEARTLAAIALIPDGSAGPDGRPFGPLPDTPIEPGSVPVVPLDVPVLYGHYWRNGQTPVVDNPRAACLDWSVAAGGPLVAYRWSGEGDLSNDKLVAVECPTEAGSRIRRPASLDDRVDRTAPPAMMSR